MKYALIWIGLVLALAQIQVGDGVSIFQNTHKLLHREPPHEVIEDRLSNVETLWITQRLNHFDALELRTWKMRYMLNKMFFKADGPLFVYVGGEWEITPGSLTSGHMYDMAKSHNALLAYTEHRFYGESKPLPDLSIESLQFLNVNQALADLEHFIRTIKEQTPDLEDSKVILVGASYAGTMVTWFKKIYPDVVKGAWASSAPLLATVNFVEHLVILGESIRRVGGADCYERIASGIDDMEKLIVRNESDPLKTLLEICDNFDDDNKSDVWNMFHQISETFAIIVQNMGSSGIASSCKRIMAESIDITGVINFLLYEMESDSDCINFHHKDKLADMRNTGYTPDMMRQWTYQTCNEFGWYQMPGSEAQPFGTNFSMNFLAAQCADLFGNTFTIDYINYKVQQINVYFGGMTPNVYNVYFTHGQLDPWRALGIQDGILATVIPDYGHCMDLSSISNKDTKEMRATKERIAELVRRWLV